MRRRRQGPDMTAVLDRGRETERAEFSIERATDPEALRSMLTDRAYAAYAIAQLEPRRFQASEWYVATGPAGKRGVVLHSTGGLGRALFVEGDTVAIDAILSLHPGARFTFASLRPEHLKNVERYFVMLRRSLMMRMLVTAESFHPAEGEAVRLEGRHIAAVNALYSTEGGPTAYTPAHLSEGVYYGVYVDSRLVSIAGTHVVSDAEGVAVVVNVFTHPRHRNRGYSARVTPREKRTIGGDQRSPKSHRRLARPHHRQGDRAKMSPSRKYDVFDEAVAQLVIGLHKRHPNIGHRGLLKALRDEGYEVDPKQLERFMDDSDIEGEGWYWQRNNIRGYLKLLGVVQEDPLNPD